MCPIRIDVTEIQWEKPPHQYKIGPNSGIQYVGGGLAIDYEGDNKGKVTLRDSDTNKDGSYRTHSSARLLIRGEACKLFAPADKLGQYQVPILVTRI